MYGGFRIQGRTVEAAMKIPEDFKPKFARRYANLPEVAVAGLKAYVADVMAGTFPDDDHSYGVDEKEYERFLGLVQQRRHV